MCSRFTLTEDDGDFLAGRLGVSTDALANYRPRYNIAPLQEHFIITTEYENRKLLPARWGSCLTGPSTGAVLSVQSML
jgi:putative SOS response-associated peptidase YedK